MNLWYFRTSGYGEYFYTTMQHLKKLKKYQGDNLFTVYFWVRWVSRVGLGIFRLHESNNKLSANKTQIGPFFLTFFSLYKGLNGPLRPGVGSANFFFVLSFAFRPNEVRHVCYEVQV